MSTIRNSLKAIKQLGITPITLNALYRILLFGGFYKWFPKPPKIDLDLEISRIELPSRQTILDLLEKETSSVIVEADEILTGKVRNYRTIPVPLVLDYAHCAHHWSLFETGHANAPAADIKDVWEPARFGWALVLARAYWITKDEKYVTAFWKYFSLYMDSNPAYLGPNWASAQEAALRLICLAFCWQIFRFSKSLPQNANGLFIKALIENAQRIPPTLIYSRSQANNHLLSEAVGLYTAAVFLPQHPLANKWKKLGKNHFYRAIVEQIDSYGEYAQHSSNYHRLMLQLALWMQLCHRIDNDNFPAHVSEKLSCATKWLLQRIDRENGRIQNLGHHDGANFLLLAEEENTSYKSVAQASCRAFLNTNFYQPGKWDELSLWLGLTLTKNKKDNFLSEIARDEVVNGKTRCFLRAHKYTNRPAHADQLHADIWYAGENITIDCGTFRYTDTPDSPWQNALADSAHHNTLRLYGSEPMLKAGRFLWLDFDQAEIISKSKKCISASRFGYSNLGANHQRTLACLTEGNIRIVDKVTPVKVASAPTLLEAFWHIPANSLSITDNSHFIFEFDYSTATFAIDALDKSNKSLLFNWQIIRAGEIILGDSQPQPLLGYHSPTYSLLKPCYTLRIWSTFFLPVIVKTSISVVAKEKF